MMMMMITLSPVQMNVFLYLAIIERRLFDVQPNRRMNSKIDSNYCRGTSAHIHPHCWSTGRPSLVGRSGITSSPSYFRPYPSPLKRHRPTLLYKAFGHQSHHACSQRVGRLYISLGTPLHAGFLTMILFIDKPSSLMEVSFLKNSLIRLGPGF